MESICCVCYLHSTLHCLLWPRTPAASSAVTQHISSRAHCTALHHHTYTPRYLHRATWKYPQIIKTLSHISPLWWQEAGLHINMNEKLDIHIDTIYTIHGSTHTGPRLVTLSALHSALAPPAHKSCHVGFILGEIGGELGWVEPDTPTSTHLARTYSYITLRLWTVRVAVMKIFRARYLPIELCYTLAVHCSVGVISSSSGPGGPHLHPHLTHLA